MRKLRELLRLDEGWSTLLLVWAMILISAYTIRQADLIDGLQVIPWTGTIAVFAGLLLAKSRFSARTAHLISLIYGFFAVAVLVGNTLPGDLLWRERVFDMISRQAVWLQKAVTGGTSRDGLIFVLQTSAIFWLLGYTASWYTFRKPRVWLAIVPTGLVLLSVVYYYIGPDLVNLYISLAIFAVLAMLYVARTYLFDQEKGWRAGDVYYERGIWFRFLRAALLATLIALLAAWMMPTLTASAAVGDAFSGASGPWREFQDTWTRLFSSLRSYASSTSDPYQESLVLGGPRSVGNTPIMDVQVAQPLSSVYWQAIVYETYEDGGWQVSEEADSTLHYAEDGALNIPFTQGRQMITQTVVNYLPNSSFLYGAPEIVATDRQMFVNQTGDGQGNILVTSLRSRYVLRLNDEYQVSSRISVADAESLRLAATDYPEYVRQRYLQVPDSITPETLELAAELVAPHDTVFDQAIAVRNYLRENIAYNDQIAAVPEGIEPIHYTLFISQEGYCNYYASAMAIMLRSQGIPARVVSGYAQGEYDEATSSYRVRASNAHTWVEVYFPDFGWIQFEPTAAIPTVERPEGGNAGDAFDGETPASGANANRDDLLPENLDDVRDIDELPDIDEFAAEDTAAPLFATVSPWQVIGVAITLLIALVLLLAAYTLNKRVEADVERSYGRLAQWARWLGIEVRPAHTPYERADLLATAVPEGHASIWNLTRQFVQRQFGSYRQQDQEFDPLDEWQVLRPRLWRTVLRDRWQRLRRRIGLARG